MKDPNWREVLKARAPIPRKRAKPRRTNQSRDPGYLAYLREFGLCAACTSCTIGELLSRHHLFCDPCHTKNGGMSMKGPDSGCAPLCRVHHDQYDGRAKLPNGEVGKVAFEAYYGLDMKAVAAKWYKMYLEQKQ